ncbi:MAG: 1,6-anhydro-N-acetylmuramyl-L-alanine amidase AmpD, partial [Burkholderiaceae bacterium]|nr:1,6-anhydro-N-acetylmuramyl-L-alanine amidase AmpD [Burkholderiaceae bacterium]
RRGARGAANSLIRRDGRVGRDVLADAADARAWHAGVSAFEGRERCNDFSIGIELEGSDDVAFEAAQYDALAALTRALQRRYRLAAVCGHQHIAPGRKTDPGPCFDWSRYRLDLQKNAAPAHPARALRFPPAA